MLGIRDSRASRRHHSGIWPASAESWQHRVMVGPRNPLEEYERDSRSFGEMTDLLIDGQVDETLFAPRPDRESDDEHASTSAAKRRRRRA
jgi:hypothetical protein